MFCCCCCCVWAKARVALYSRRLRGSGGRDMDICLPSSFAHVSPITCLWVWEKDLVVVPKSCNICNKKISCRYTFLNSYGWTNTGNATATCCSSRSRAVLVEGSVTAFHELLCLAFCYPDSTAASASRGWARASLSPRLSSANAEVSIGYISVCECN